GAACGGATGGGPSGTGGAGAGIASGEPGASSGWSDTARLPELRTTVTAAPHASSPAAAAPTRASQNRARAFSGPSTATAAPRDDASTSHLSACRPSAILRRPTLTRGNDHLDTALRTSHPHP